jgi:hypothetical protein
VRAARLVEPRGIADEIEIAGGVAEKERAAGQLARPGVGVGLKLSRPLRGDDAPDPEWGLCRVAV